MANNITMPVSMGKVSVCEEAAIALKNTKQLNINTDRVNFNFIQFRLRMLVYTKKANSWFQFLTNKIY